MRVAERGGTSLKTKLVKSEVGRYSICGAPNCYLDIGGEVGGHHHRAGALYQATCSIGDQAGISASYVGESGDSGYTRCLTHLEAVREDDPKRSALALHLKEYHPQHLKQEDAFKVKVVKTFMRPMECQITEGMMIHNTKADIVMNRKDEWVAPAAVRLLPTN